MPQGRRPPLNELVMDDFVDLLRKGILRFAACNQLGITVAQVQNAYRANPDFRAEVDDALHEASEKVEDALFSAATSGEPWAVRLWLQSREKERWGPAPVKIQVSHELDGVALLESVAGLAAELEQRRLHATSIATGGQMIEIEPVRRYEHPAVYDLGKAPVMPNEILRKMKDTYGLPRHAHSVPVENVDSPLLNELPRRPGT